MLDGFQSITARRILFEIRGLRWLYARKITPSAVIAETLPAGSKLTSNAPNAANLMLVMSMLSLWVSMTSPFMHGNRWHQRCNIFHSCEFCALMASPHCDQKLTPNFVGRAKTRSRSRSRDYERTSAQISAKRVQKLLFVANISVPSSVRGPSLHRHVPYPIPRK